MQYPGITQSQRFLPSSVVMESLYFFHSAELCEFFLRFTFKPTFSNYAFMRVFCPRSKKSVMISIINVMPTRLLHLFQHDSQTMIKINDFWIKSYWTLLRIDIILNNNVIDHYNCTVVFLAIYPLFCRIDTIFV